MFPKVLNPAPSLLVNNWAFHTDAPLIPNHDTMTCYQWTRSPVEWSKQEFFWTYHNIPHRHIFRKTKESDNVKYYVAIICHLSNKTFAGSSFLNVSICRFTLLPTIVNMTLWVLGCWSPGWKCSQPRHRRSCEIVIWLAARQRKKAQTNE